RGLNGVADVQAAAEVSSIGKNDHGFAPDFFGELFLCPQIDGVVEQSATRHAGGGKWTLADAGTGSAARAAADVDLHAVHGALQIAGGGSEVLQQFHVDVKADQESHVFGPQHILKKSASHLLLHGEHALLAAAGIDQYSQR